MTHARDHAGHGSVTTQTRRRLRSYLLASYRHL
jgi:hypothetical protein